MSVYSGRSRTMSPLSCGTSQNASTLSCLAIRSAPVTRHVSSAMCSPKTTTISTLSSLKGPSLSLCGCVCLSVCLCVYCLMLFSSMLMSLGFTQGSCRILSLLVLNNVSAFLYKQIIFRTYSVNPVKGKDVDWLHFAIQV